MKKKAVNLTSKQYVKICTKHLCDSCPLFVLEKMGLHCSELKKFKKIRANIDKIESLEVEV